MKSSVELKNELFKIDGKGYKAYKVLEGKYDFKKYVLSMFREIHLLHHQE